MSDASALFFKGYSDFGDRLSPWGGLDLFSLRLHDGLGDTSDSLRLEGAGDWPPGYRPSHVQLTLAGNRHVFQIVDLPIQIFPESVSISGKGVVDGNSLAMSVRRQLRGSLSAVLAVRKYKDLEAIVAASGTSIGELVRYELADSASTVRAVMSGLADWSLGIRAGRVVSSYRTYRTTRILEPKVGSLSFTATRGGMEPSRAVNRRVRGVYQSGGDMRSLSVGREEPGLDVNQRFGSELRCHVWLLLKQMSAFHASARMEFDTSRGLEYELGDRLLLPASLDVDWHSWVVIGLTHNFTERNGLETAVTAAPTYTDS